jgi:hypothetical protein
MTYELGLELGVDVWDGKLGDTGLHLRVEFVAMVVRIR